jgi:hypothetical protein
MSPEGRSSGRSRTVCSQYRLRRGSSPGPGPAVSFPAGTQLPAWLSSWVPPVGFRSDGRSSEGE